MSGKRFEIYQNGDKSYFFIDTKKPTWDESRKSFNFFSEAALNDALDCCRKNDEPPKLIKTVD